MSRYFDRFIVTQRNAKFLLAIRVQSSVRKQQWPPTFSDLGTGKINSELSEDW
jgi:hypothetical protein